MTNIIEALKERLEKYRQVAISQGYSTDYRAALNDFEAALDSFQSSRTWHDPEEKLPEDGAIVFVETKYDEIYRMIYVSGQWRSDNYHYVVPPDSVRCWTPRYVDTPPPMEEER